ncbi:hypothetical protein LSTR_LSTR011077, partial [Laodelphax striatellus]
MEVARTESVETPSASPIPQEQHPVDLVRLDYVEELGSRLELVEGELQHAWRALAVLSQEYTKIWERLERLEDMLYDQQSVISQLIKFYSSVDGQESLVIRETLAEMGIRPVRPLNYFSNPTITDSADVTISEMDVEMSSSDEAFYRSLNSAYRDDLICTYGGTAAAGGTGAIQLGMIYEESEEDSNGANGGSKRGNKRSKDEVFTALDYREYRGDSPCISEHDLVQASQLSTIDQAALQKLRELDSLSTKLKKDSQNLKKIQNTFLAMQNKERLETVTNITEYSVTEPDADFIENQIRRLYNESTGVVDVSSSQPWMYRPQTPGSVSLPGSNLHHRTLPEIPSIEKDDGEATDEISEYVRNISSTPTSPRKFVHNDSPAVSRKYAST